MTCAIGAFGSGTGNFIDGGQRGQQSTAQGARFGTSSSAPAYDYTYTAFRKDYATQVQAGFAYWVSEAHFVTGAAHEFFQTVQADGGDIRAFKADGTTEMPFELAYLDKAAGKINGWVYSDVALDIDDWWNLRTGGSGSEVARAADSTYGAQNVWPTANIIAHELTVNTVDGAAIATAGLTDVAGSNGLRLKNFGPEQNHYADPAGNILSPTAVTHWFIASRAGNGTDDGFGRMFQFSATGDEAYNDGTTGNYVYSREYDGVGNMDADWSWVRPALNAATLIIISHDGGAGLPIISHNGVGQAVSVKAAVTGSAASNAADLLHIGNHDVVWNKGWDGNLGEFGSMTGAVNLAWHQAFGAMLTAPATFMRARPGESSKPTFVPSRYLEAWLDALVGAQPDLAQKIRLDDLLIKPIRDIGAAVLLDCFNVAGHTEEAFTRSLFNPSTFVLTAVGSPVYTAFEGAVFNGSNNAYNMNYQPPAGVATRNAHSIGVYINTNAQFASGVIGAARTTSDTVTSVLNPRTSGDVMTGKVSDLQTVTSTAGVTDARGLSTMVRTSSTVNKFYKGNAQLGADVTSASDDDVDFPWYVGGINRASDVFVACDVFAALGGGILTAAMIAVISDQLDAYKAALP